MPLTVEDILILLKSKLLAREGGLGLLLGLLLCSSGEPELIVAGITGFSLHSRKVHGAAVSPPELSTDAPVVDVFQPAEVALLGRLRLDLDLTVPNNLHGRLGQSLGAHPPLRLHDGLNNVLGLIAQRNLHGVVLLIHVQTLLLQIVLDGVTDVESL